MFERTVDEPFEECADSVNWFSGTPDLVIASSISFGVNPF